MTDQEFTAILREYSDHFDEAYPLYGAPADWDEEKIAADVRRCIEQDAPARPDYQKGNIY